MNKSCIFLSTSNIELMTNLRECGRKYNKNVSTQILEMVAINNNLTLRALQNSIRPVLKQYTQLIKNTTKTSKVTEMII